MAQHESSTPDHVHSASEMALRFAVIGSGPAGIYACESLLARADRAHPDGHDPNILIDLIERLPVPYGLLRFGVAPDHPRIKGIARVLHEIVRDPRIRYLGGVEFGTDLTIEDVRGLYHGLVLATGALADRRMGIPGENLDGVHGAAEFVTWYDGHPDAASDWDLSAARAVVVGVGNVALDVARMLLRSPEELAGADIPTSVREHFSAGRARVVSILGRRGPAYVKFTPQELAEIGSVDNVTVLVDPADLELDSAAEARLAADRRARKMFEQLRTWAGEWAQAYPQADTVDAAEEAALAAGRKLVRFRFHTAPQEFVGVAGKVSAVRVARTSLVDDTLRTSTNTTDIPADAVYTAVGYRSTALAGVPFDEDAAVIPNTAGRVLDAPGGTPLPGLYTAGWVKRGPSGVIGTNRSCAAESVDAVWADLAAGALVAPAHPEPEAVLDLLAERGVRVVDGRAWAAIDAHEQALGAAEGRERTKIRDRAEMFDVAFGALTH